MRGGMKDQTWINWAYVILLLLILITVGTCFGLKAEAQIDTTFYEGIRYNMPYPNPFKDQTVLVYLTPYPYALRFEVRNILARLIFTKEVIPIQHGANEFRIREEDLPSSGIYFITLIHGKEIITTKIIHIK